jgi:hypothetical protein
MMNRRDALKYTGLTFGYALTATSLSTLMTSCQADVESDGWSPSTLSKAQSDLLAEFAETLIPRTETPGAKDVLVHRYIDSFLTGCLNDEDRQTALVGIKGLEDHLNSAGDKKFVQLDDAGRMSILQELNAAAIAAEEPSELQGTYLEMKSLVISTFFTSEKIGTEVLAYAPVPGPFKGCIPLEEVGKAWALQ